MGPRSGWVVLGAVALLVLLVGSAAVAGASAEPKPVCTVCGAVLHEDVEQSTVEIVVDGAGDARWTVRNRIGNASLAERLADDPVARQRLVDDALAGGVYDDPEAVETALEGDVLVIEFVDRDAARSSAGGVRLLPSFHAEGSGNRLALNADEVTVRGADGYAVANEPAGASVEDGRAVWTGSSGDEWDAPEIENAYVAIAPEGRSSAWATLAIWRALASIAIGNAVTFVLPSLVLFAAGLAATTAGTRAFAARIRPWMLAVAGVGGVAPAVLGVGWLPPPTDPGTVLLALVAVVALPATGYLAVRGGARLRWGALLGTVALYGLALAVLLSLTEFVHGLAMVATIVLTLCVLGLAVPAVFAGGFVAAARESRVGDERPK